MEVQLKQRLLGTVVLISVAIIVLPLLLDGEGYRAMQQMEIEAPKRPKFGYRQESFTVPLNDILTPPQPMDIKGFNDGATESVAPEQKATEADKALDAPILAPELTTTWVMQVGSFSIEENALAVRKKLAVIEAENTTIEIETEKVDDKEVYVVKVISDDYETLSKIAHRIKQDYPDAFIKERE